MRILTAVERLKLGGLLHPNEGTVKDVATIVACHEFADNESHWPSPQEAFDLVHEVKSLWAQKAGPRPYRKSHLLTYPHVPADLDSSLFQAMYDVSDPPVTKKLTRLVLMKDKMVMRSTNKSLRTAAKPGPLQLACATDMSMQKMFMPILTGLMPMLGQIMQGMVSKQREGHITFTPQGGMQIGDPSVEGSAAAGSTAGNIVVDAGRAAPMAITSGPTAGDRLDLDKVTPLDGKLGVASADKLSLAMIRNSEGFANLPGGRAAIVDG